MLREEREAKKRAAEQRELARERADLLQRWALKRWLDKDWRRNPPAWLNRDECGRLLQHAMWLHHRRLTALGFRDQAEANIEELHGGGRS